MPARKRRRRSTLVCKYRWRCLLWLVRKGMEVWSSRKMEELQTRIRRKRFRSFSIYALRYAAVAAIAIIGTWFAFTQYSGLGDTTGTLIDVPKGQRVYITLADGTEAWLSPRTKVRVPNQFNKKNRVVELDGRRIFLGGKRCKTSFYSPDEKV